VRFREPRIGLEIAWFAAAAHNVGRDAALSEGGHDDRPVADCGRFTVVDPGSGLGPRAGAVATWNTTARRVPVKHGSGRDPAAPSRRPASLGYYTLGGGLGWLMSTQGLACDNLSDV
jgi:hypothetical protein